MLLTAWRQAVWSGRYQRSRSGAANAAMSVATRLSISASIAPTAANIVATAGRSSRFKRCKVILGLCQESAYLSVSQDPSLVSAPSSTDNTITRSAICANGCATATVRQLRVYSSKRWQRSLSDGSGQCNQQRTPGRHEACLEYVHGHRSPSRAGQPSAHAQRGMSARHRVPSFIPPKEDRWRGRLIS